jgi:phosphatidylserine/phosphatidylglycerophosphate/cardiolipin synthase-like enzyme
MPTNRDVLTRLLAVLLAACSLAACSTVIRSTRALDAPPPATVVERTDHRQTALGSAYADRFAEDPSINAVAAINPGFDALTHRVALTRLAERSIEMQAYIFKNDLSTMLLLRELMLAADRGVKVRILIDDVGLPPGSSELLLLGFHPNMEVRIFNPFRFRIGNTPLRFSQFIFEFHRLNRRLHNKLFIADDSVLVIGGRNISKEYFDKHQDFNFLDADILLIGHVASDGADSFDEYWDFHMSIPSTFFPEHRDPGELKEFVAKLEKTLAANQDFVDAVDQEANEIIARHRAGEVPEYWAKARLVADPPKKAEGLMEGNRILDEVNVLLDNATSAVHLSNAYVVPLDFVDKFNQLRERGVEIHLSTNSLSSNDVWVVYSGWINYRTDLIDRGVHVHEFRHDADFARRPEDSRSGLHSKIIVVDGRYSVYGSLNLDPRSVWLNTETIVIIDSEPFSQAVIRTLQEEMSDGKSWKVRRIDGRTVWESSRDGETVTVNHSPDVFILKRILARVVSYIVPEWLL